MSVDTKEEDADNKLSENAKEAAAVTGENVHVKEMVDHIEEISSSPSSSSVQDNKTEKEEEDDEEEKGEASSAMAEEDADLTEHERKALADLRSKLEEAILTNTMLKKKQGEESNEDKGKAKVPPEEEDNNNNNNEKKTGIDTDTDIDIDTSVSLWGVPLLPSKGEKSTDVLLVKFLRAREFKANEALEMLKSSLEWRKGNRIDLIMEEEFGNEYDRVSYMKGVDRQGHPVCYNVYGVFANEEIYNKTFGSQGGRERFLRWRLQLLEKEIQKLDFTPGLLQVNDLKDTPGPSRRDLRHATKQAVAVLQDNYPEFVSRNIFINVPFWYYAFNALLSPFLTQATKSKFVFSRPARVTETLVKYIAAEEIPIAYGGLLREDDTEFSTKDVASEIIVKAGATEYIEIRAPEIGRTLIWDVTIVGWDVNYKEEFVPSDPNSYTLIVKKQRKISWQSEPIRNTFKNKEAGKLVITVENGMFKKKKVLYRFKIKN